MPLKKHFSEHFCPIESAQNTVKTLESVFDDVIFNKRSESLILCGPSGCGKSMIVEEALLVYSEDKKAKSKFQCVRIDGTLAMDVSRSVDCILQQLTPEVKLRTNGTVVGTAAEKLKELCDTLQNLSTKMGKKSVIFVMDHLENFTNQRNQLLLYTLFDCARSQAFPICVIGLSTVLDVLEKMEKRVKSRFSQHVIVVSSSLFSSLGEYNQAVKFVLEQRFPELSSKELNAVFAQPSAIAVLTRLYEYRKDWHVINMFAELVASNRSDSRLSLDLIWLENAARTLFSDSAQCIIRDLPHLHLAVLLCCFDFIESQQENSFNYNMVQEVYQTTVKQKYRSLKFDEQFVSNAFVELENSGLLRSITTKGRSEPRQYRNFSMEISKWQLRAAMKEMDLTGLPTDLRQWCEAICK